MTRRKSKMRRKPIRAAKPRVYPKHPVGSNEWVRQQMIRFRQRRFEEEQKKKKLRENPDSN